MGSRSDLIDVALELKQDRELSYAVTDGTKDANGKEVWVFLPKKNCQNNEDGTFTMPEWLAKEKGLI